MGSGQEVPTSTVEVKPCSNFIALGLGLLDTIGSVTELDSLDYWIGDT